MKAPDTLERNDALQREIQDFFDEVSLQTSERQVCPNCGKEMEYLETTFLWYGTDSTWDVHLPICPCQLSGHLKNDVPR
jgi:hypothetical protein